MTRIAVFGAGAIGCWIGGRLAAAGSEVVLVGRPRVIDELRRGLRTSDLDGATRSAMPALATDASAVARAALVLVTVKSAATAAAAEELAPHLATNTIVVSLQNGVRNASVLRQALPRHSVLAGMVPFNVIRREAALYHRASAGKIMVDDVAAAAPLAEALALAGVPFELRGDMTGVQWSKLVLNLNNAINALSGLPLARELADRDFRRCLAAAQREAVALIRAAGHPLARVIPLPTRWIPRLLAVPDPLFRILGARIVAIDPSARSSMSDDLEAKRPTEIDYINGEIVALADRIGGGAPVNRKLVELVKEAERGGKRDYTAAELYAAVTRELRRPTA